MTQNRYRHPGLILHSGDGPQYTEVEDADRQWCTAEGIEPLIATATPGGQPISELAGSLVESGPDAIYDLSGSILEVLEGVAELSLNVPHDVGVVSRSEGDVAASMNPRVTSMSMCGQEVGRILGEATSRAMGRPLDVRERVVCPYELTVRASTSRLN